MSPVELSADHVDRSEGGNHVGDQAPCQEFGQGRHDGKAWWTNPDPVRVPASVTHHVEPELPVGSFHRVVHFSFWRAARRGRA